ncbi:MAG: acyltransferase [Eubacteriales bacterium]
MEQRKQSNKEYAYAIMTVITTFLVVAGHIGFSKTPNHTISYDASNGAQHILNTIIGVIYSFHMPLFFFVSGAVFGYVYNRKPYTFGGLIWKKTKRLAVPFYTTRFFYILPLKLLLGIYALSNLPRLIKRLVLLGDLDHLWFLVILFYIFIIAFFLRKYLFKFKIPVMLLLLAGLAFYDHVSWAFLLNITFAYIIYFYMGLVFNEYQEKITTKGALTMAVIGIAAYVVLYFKSEFFYGHESAFLQKGLSLGFDLLQAILGIGVIYGISKALSVAGAQNTKLFKGLYKHGFNIYLFHSTLNYVVLVCFERWGWFDWVNLSDVNAGIYILFRLAFTYLVPLLISVAVFGVKDWFKKSGNESKV